MGGRLRENHWVPTGMHGIVPMPDDGDIETRVAKKMSRLVPANFRQPVNHFDYIIHTGEDGNQYIVFEVKEFGDE